MSTSHAVASNFSLTKNKKGCNRSSSKDPDEHRNDCENEHVQLSSQVETEFFYVPPQTVINEEKYIDKIAPTRNKFWDEVEMKHHGLVDDHAHHKDVVMPPENRGLSTDQKNKANETNQVNHKPFDEVELKHGGFVDNHCRHLTKDELENDHGIKNDAKHVQFEPGLVSEDLFTTEEEPIKNSNQQRKELRLEPEIDTFDVERVENDKYDIEIQSHTPWDECEMKNHGLVDKQGYHKKLPEDDVQLHPEGKIDEHFNRNELNLSQQPIQIRPFDEVAIKQSGHVDQHCHHLTDAELDEPSASPSVGHIEIKPTLSFQSPTSSQDSKMLESFQNNAQISKDKTKERENTKQERPKVDSTGSVKTSLHVKSKKKTKKLKRKAIYKTKIQGVVNITEKNSNDAKL